MGMRQGYPNPPRKKMWLNFSSPLDMCMVTDKNILESGMGTRNVKQSQPRPNTMPNQNDALSYVTKSTVLIISDGGEFV